MPTYVLDSNRARTQWREILDKTDAGEASVVIERYGKPVAVLIPYEDFMSVQEQISDLRASRRTAAIYEEWLRDPSLAEPWTQVRAELVAEGLIDDHNTKDVEGRD